MPYPFVGLDLDNTGKIENFFFSTENSFSCDWSLIQGAQSEHQSLSCCLVVGG